MRLCSGTHDARLVQALASMREALQLLDEAAAAPDIGAHLDLAICRLESVISDAAPTVVQLSSRRPAAPT